MPIEPPIQMPKMTSFRTLVFVVGLTILQTASATFAQEPAAPVADCQCPTTDSSPPAEEFRNWWETFSLFAAPEASRQPQDLGINANFGANISANLGVPLWPELGVGAQLGAGVNLSRAGVKVLKVVEGTNDRVQWFNTFGLFRRGELGYAAVAYDLQYSDYYEHISAGQFRAEVGWNIGSDDVVGLWGTASAQGDNVSILGKDYRITPISQIAAFWNRRWMAGAETRVWMGVAGQHGTDIVLLPDDHRTDPSITFGLQIFVPLNEHFALFGQGNFITPSDTGTLDAYLGLAYFFGGAARSRSNRFAPVLPVANNPTFALDLRSP